MQKWKSLIFKMQKSNSTFTAVLLCNAKFLHTHTWLFLTWRGLAIVRIGFRASFNFCAFGVSSSTDINFFRWTLRMQHFE